MKKFKTNKEIALYDNRGNMIGSFTLHMIINEMRADRNSVQTSGFYYYEQDGRQVVLDSFTNPYSWGFVQQGEQALQPLAGQNIKDLIMQRISDIAYLQQQIEAGKNWGTLPEDWIEDDEDENI